MALKPVEAVFVIFYGTAAHKATYGRDVVGDKTYTKDYIQLSKDAVLREALERLFPRQNAGDESTRINYRWPGGSLGGAVKFQSSDRPHLEWLKTTGAPRPWRMTPFPTESTQETIPGDPTETDPLLATKQLDQLKSLGIQPYLIAVELKDDPGVLHVRAYIDSPLEKYAFASTVLLPEEVKSLAYSTSRTRALKWAVFDANAGVMTPDIAEAVKRLEENPALLLIGPPGTGKTVLLESLVNFVEHPGRRILFDPDRNHNAWDVEDYGIPGKARSIVFHPSYSYDNLVLGLLPQPAKGNGVSIKAVPGPLVNLAHYCSEDGRRALLILDEFNRANAAAVLGDALALLDKDKRGKTYIDLPYSDLGVEVPIDFEANGTRKIDSRFTLPPNLWIVAAMNTSDRSVAPLDAALRRRFTIVEMAPNYDALAQQLGADDEADLLHDVKQWELGHVGKLAVELLSALNRRIDAVLGVDFRLGQSNFWHVGGETVEASLLSLALAFDHRIVQTLRLSLQDDDGALAAILRAGTPDQPLSANPTIAWWEKADAELGTYASDRLHLGELSAMPFDQAFAELRRQAKL